MQRAPVGALNLLTLCMAATCAVVACDRDRGGANSGSGTSDSGSSAGTEPAVGGTSASRSSAGTEPAVGSTSGRGSSSGAEPAAGGTSANGSSAGAGTPAVGGTSGSGASGGSSSGGSSYAGASATQSGGTSGVLTEGQVPTDLSFLLHYLGAGLLPKVHALVVDDTYVYWLGQDLYYRRIPLGGGQEELFYTCPTCDFVPKVSRDGYLFFLDGTELVQVHRDTKEESSIELPHSHSGGGLLVEDDYVYTAIRGCAAILRIERSSQSVEVAYVPDVSYPGRGATALARAGDALVCASPTEIMVMPGWNAPVQRIFSDADCLFDVANVGDQIYWWQIPSSVYSSDSIGSIAVAGGAPTWASIPPEGAASQLVYVPPADALVVGNRKGLQGYSRDSGVFDFLVAGDGATQLAANSEALFCAFRGERPIIVDGISGMTSHYWIGKVPFQTIVDAKANR